MNHQTFTYGDDFYILLLHKLYSHAIGPYILTQAHMLKKPSQTDLTLIYCIALHTRERTLYTG